MISILSIPHRGWQNARDMGMGMPKAQLSESLEQATFTLAPNWPARARAPEHIEIRCSFVGLRRRGLNKLERNMYILYL